jgi:hypothetical protein
MTKDEIIARQRVEITRLTLSRDLPVDGMVTVYGYPLDKVLQMIEAHEMRVGAMPNAIVRGVVDEVCAETGVSEEDLLSTRRTHEIARARMLAMRRLYDKGEEWSMPRVGRVFKRDHTTVLHALRVWPEGS